MTQYEADIIKDELLFSLIEKTLEETDDIKLIVMAERVGLTPMLEKGTVEEVRGILRHFIAGLWEKHFDT